MGTWNAIRINGPAKREVVVDVFKKEKFKSLALTETKLNRKIMVWSKWYHYRCSGDRKS